MISFAQNQEDVVLARLLTVIEVGSFIDVGAGHPILENVTYGLYQAGWRGVNIEPMQREAELLRSERPADLTLQIAVSDCEATIMLYEAPLENRGATTSVEATVERYRNEGQQFTQFEVDAMPLRDVWARHVHGDVHVLKIDVEGMERLAIEGLDLHRNRPWVLVVEATAPNSQVETWQEWEPIVLSHGYEFTLFDGLNRFYVDSAHPELIGLLSKPANVFDNWTPYVLSLTEDRASAAESYVAELLERLKAAESYVAELLDRLKAAERYALSLAERSRRAEEYAAALARERESAAPHIAHLVKQAALAEELGAKLKLIESTNSAQDD